ncbi:hypothetical protein HX858_06280 [Marine Group I thaumarchaeote]|uniref:Uncharacterized protein n=1 Tax=Marine Group I thaumarchaeote TaxID=2511932 RepID=A0A7K4MX12_9ARCH|nr:hypothetical protein [Marine Group I thaumarchaeote]
MTTTTKTIGSRVNNEVHTLFTDVCNNEGITMSQKINQLVTDCVSFPSKKENKVESEPLILSGNVSQDKKMLDDLPREILEKSIRILDSKNRKEQTKFSQSEDAVKAFLKKLENKKFRVKCYP